MEIARASHGYHGHLEPFSTFKNRNSTFVYSTRMAIIITVLDTATPRDRRDDRILWPLERYTERTD
ncbi:Protein of unknown function [Pyronema omphalodes CBS 100304]|uniref:Uncharacterized protein n=1 Tax=Pyronema omphalodes (strain CBS 100304) TaxID=1076935 RepID=U4KX45_PYROM|nr:Protein of unknown function [Pyronema omphalodes CBS 100304]